ncbi:hypothetical protein LRM36_01725 [Stenotrophomonas maltophilia]|nr:hypothetical protein [Stenotrophomonas maltophilia]
MKRSRRFSPSPLALPMNRDSEAVRARRYLQRRRWPRLQMALIVALAGSENAHGPLRDFRSSPALRYDRRRGPGTWPGFNQP